MAKKGLQWTPEQLEVARLLRSGLSPQAVIGQNHKKSLVYKVRDAIKDELRKPAETKPSGGEQPPPQTRLLPRVTSEVSVGEILIQPEDWRVNQTGALLILGTYEESKRRFSYGGTVGEFLCDACNIIRQLMGMTMVPDDYLWKEGNNGAKHGQGAGVPTEVREISVGPGGEDPGDPRE